MKKVLVCQICGSPQVSISPNVYNKQDRYEHAICASCSRQPDPAVWVEVDDDFDTYSDRYDWSKDENKHVDAYLMSFELSDENFWHEGRVLTEDEARYIKRLEELSQMIVDAMCFGTRIRAEDYNNLTEATDYLDSVRAGLDHHEDEEE
ncbi:MAG: hypothetical protein FWF12_00090 [Betaproteobacteria bacterium]|nr:hypothetical protein [Betaproteobacteria bacterium]